MKTDTETLSLVCKQNGMQELRHKILYQDFEMVQILRKFLNGNVEKKINGI